ncbi:CaiB/BaiF CoA-transferase family protein [Streptodolium elevatio]|uniref:CoA transferase n=1 Tax=Streptodolium elevatio TaxID=3157996 RepID=A0ABV3DTY1_9ACTN
MSHSNGSAAAAEEVPVRPASSAALRGVRVVEAGRGIAVSYAAKLLRDQGASVVKVDDDDPLRRWSAASPDEPLTGDGPLWSFLQLGKTIVTQTPAEADIVLTSAGWDGRAPVVVHVTPFGLDGPLAGRVANEFTLQAWCGLMSACGTKDSPPLPMGAGPGEWATGATAALAALAGRRAGGATVDVAALEVMAVCLNNYPTLYREFTGNVAALSRSGDWPSVVRCKDGWVGLCIFTAQQWADFAVMIDRPDLAEDERCTSMGARSRNRAFVEANVGPRLAGHTAAEIVELGGLFRVPVALIGNGEPLFDMEHPRERGVFLGNPAGFRQPRSPVLHHGRPGHDDHAGPAAATQRTTRPLEGVRVVDLTAFWAGPYATHLLAALGAEVVKVESPTRPDGMRFATVKSPAEPDWMEFGPTFHGTNPGKRSVTVDLATEDGRARFLRLVATADVVVENFTPRVMDGLGLGYDELRRVKPDLVMLRQPGFGLDGPWANHAAFAQTMEQTTGIAWLTGLPDGEPLVRSTIDPITGLHGAFAVLTALERRAATGQGELVEVPMLEVALNIAAEPIVTWSATGYRMDRQGARGPGAVPQGVYRCAGEEQWAALAVETDEQWQALARLTGWGADLATRAERRARHDEIDERLAAWFADRDRDATAELILNAGVPAAPVWDQMLQDELPQLVARHFYQPLEHPIAGTVRHPGIGMHSQQLDLTLRGPAPTLGQHTEEVLRDA